MIASINVKLLFTLILAICSWQLSHAKQLPQSHKSNHDVKDNNLIPSLGNNKATATSAQGQHGLEYSTSFMFWNSNTPEMDDQHKQAFKSAIVNLRGLSILDESMITIDDGSASDVKRIKKLFQNVFIVQINIIVPDVFRDSTVKLLDVYFSSSSATMLRDAYNKELLLLNLDKEASLILVPDSSTIAVNAAPSLAPSQQQEQLSQTESTPKDNSQLYYSIICVTAAVTIAFVVFAAIIFVRHRKDEYMKTGVEAAKREQQECISQTQSNGGNDVPTKLPDLKSDSSVLSMQFVLGTEVIGTRSMESSKAGNSRRSSTDEQPGPRDYEQPEAPEVTEH